MLLLFSLFTLAVVHAQCDPPQQCKPLVNSVGTDLMDLNQRYNDAVLKIKNDQSLTTEDFKNELKSIIRIDHQCISYDCTWSALMEIDENKTTPTDVTGFYSQKPFKKSNRVCEGKNKRADDRWNREHVFPEGRFNFSDSKERSCAKADLHHLVASDETVNSGRNNKDFLNGGDRLPEDYKDCLQCKVTKGTDPYGTFEPPDKQKGAVARMLFYAAMRYDNLTIVEFVDPPKDNTIGDLCTLLEWHNTFSVTQVERERNDAVRRWQGNRNPFIDYPELVTRIWGDEECPKIDSNFDPDEVSDEVADEVSDVDSNVDPGVPDEAVSDVLIVAAFINPDGGQTEERKNEWVLIKNVSPNEISLEGFELNDKSSRPPLSINGTLAPGAVKCLNSKIQNFADSIQLKNKGGSLTLKNTDGDNVHSVKWNKTKEGIVTKFNKTIQCISTKCEECTTAHDEL